jgi:phosphoribosylformylglycinamidine synthase
MLGAEVKIPIKTRTDFSLFSESQSRIIVSASPNNKENFESKLKEFNQPFTYLGKAGGKGFKINDEIDLEVNKISDIYYNSIPNIMNSEK